LHACRPAKAETDLARALQSHLQLLEDEYRRRGLTADDAKHAAKRSLGGVEFAKDLHRDARSFVWLDDARRDVRYALRMLGRSPGFTAVAALTLALGIGATTAIFSIVNAILLHPLPYESAERLVRLYENIPAAESPNSKPRRIGALDTRDLLELRAHSRTLSHVITYSFTTVTVSGCGDAMRLRGAPVSAATFPMLGVQPLVGRWFTPDEERPGQDRVILLGHNAWQRCFARDPNVLGRVLTFTGRAAGPLGGNVTLGQYTVVGIMPGDVHFPDDDAQFWIPGSLEPGPALLLLWAAVGIILIVACANITNLLTARNVARTREISIRRALGASRSRLVMQGLTESALLAAGGAAGGLVIARMAAAALRVVDPETFPRLDDLRFDPVVLLFAAGLGIVTTLATGILPAIQAANAAPPRTVTNAPTRRHRRLQQLLCVTQLGAAVVLLIAATLFGRSLVGLLQTDLGVTPEHVVTASINTAFGRPHSADEIAGTMLRVVERVQQIPGVHAVGAGTSLPPDTSRIMMSLKRKSDDVDYVASAVSCTPGYFQALGIRLVKGRFFTATDDAQHPAVIIVSATTARHLFGTDDPIGQTFTVPKFQFRLGTGKEATVVGIVSDVKYSGIEATAGDQVYWSLAQAPWLSTFLTIRTTGDVNIASELRQMVASVDPTVAVSSIKPLDGLIATATAPARFRTTLMAAFALIGLAIASIGLYGVVAYSVSQRTAEIGVRVALGADRRNVISLVMRESVAIGGAGVAIGLPAAYAMSRTFAALLFGVKPTDVFTYVVSAVLRHYRVRAENR
jgi:ABC-type antimicrobial peptide transport system permease subunit